MSRRQFEFSRNVYESVLSRGICEECGGGYDKDDPWRVHHKVFISWALQHDFPHLAITSIANASLLHKSCHDHIHNLLDEPMKKDIDEVMNYYRGMTKQARMFLDSQQNRPRRIS